MVTTDLKETFFALVRAGLWEKEVRLLPFGEVDYQEVMRLAEEQSVVGLVTAGMEHIADTKAPKTVTLVFIGNALKIEERNKAMNRFVANLSGKMREAGIRAVLVKGQGVAQCYERPLWRSSGDLDFLLDAENYEKAKSLLSPLATKVETEDRQILHQGLEFDPWTVELHGTMRTQLSSRINRGIDDAHHEVCENGGTRRWINDGVEVLLPNPDSDIVLVFTHFLNHFYGSGIGLRQVCDWCRLLWTYRDSIETELLESRLLTMGLMTEWQVFAAFAVDYLGMPKECMPLYIESSKMKRRATKLANWMLRSGKRRHDQDDSYRTRHSKLVANCITFGHRLNEFAHIATIFPQNAPKFFVHYVFVRFKATML